jgi:diguanylate cyclase (GGDEF)-like protein
MRADERRLAFLPAGGVVAIAVGLVAPLLVGSFAGRELLALAAIELVCALVVAVSAVRFVRRLEASHAYLWALSRRDELTGVGNYRALHERLGEELSRHRRRQREFALILIDLDGFKQVNEKLGHLEGDRLLTEIGEALRDEVRGEDSVFRQGGDEFAVVAPEINGEEAEDVAARLRARVSGCGAGVRISAGTGFAVFPADGHSISELIACADRDLLGAKRDGRFG